jgi:hypothetical protein
VKKVDGYLILLITIDFGGKKVKIKKPPILIISSTLKKKNQ